MSDSVEDKVTVVDAVKTEPATAPSNLVGVTVPVKLDASALSKALQAAAAQSAPEKVNTGELIKNSGAKIEDIYRRFEALKVLTNELHGKAVSDPLPSNVKLEEISFSFRLNNRPDTPFTAVVKNVAFVSDIAVLLFRELGVLIAQLEQEAAAVKSVATQAEEASSKARAAWMANSLNRPPASNETPGTAQTNATDSV